MMFSDAFAEYIQRADDNMKNMCRVTWQSFICSLAAGKPCLPLPKDLAHAIGTNACSEIAIRFCNFSGRDIVILSRADCPVYYIGLRENIPVDKTWLTITTVTFPCNSFVPDAPKKTVARKTPNAWILYRKCKQTILRLRNPSLTVPMLSHLISLMWEIEPARVKNSYIRMAAAEAARQDKIKNPKSKAVTSDISNSRIIIKEIDKEFARNLPLLDTSANNGTVFPSNLCWTTTESDFGVNTYGC